MNGAYGKAVGYVKSDGSVVFIVEGYESWKGLAYSWKKKCFYEVYNKGKSTEEINWYTQRDFRFTFEKD